MKWNVEGWCWECWCGRVISYPPSAASSHSFRAHGELIHCGIVNNRAGVIQRIRPAVTAR